MNYKMKLINEESVMYNIGIDIGFGDVKVVVGNDQGKITELYKFPSVLAPVSVSDYVKDSRVVRHGDVSYYVGNDALAMESTGQYSVDEYKHLETFTPVILSKILRELNQDTAIKSVVLGLSIAHIAYSSNYKEAIEKYLASIGSSSTSITVMPQGAGIKLAYDKYYDKFPTLSQAHTATSTYLICDIGFNTIDILYVIDGKVSPNRIGGIENMGLVVVAKMLNNKISEKYSDLDLSIKDLKDVLDKGYLKLRGVQIDFSDDIIELKTQYLRMIESMMEDRYGKVMNKIDFLLLAGGGSMYFNDILSKFYRSTGPQSSYYNAIGYFERSLK